MELRELRVFQRVAELGNLHDAAETLGVSQPAVSKAVRRLETSLGARLFERTARGVALTSIGQVLFSRSALLLQTADEIPREITDLQTGKAHQLRVGAVPGLVEHVLCPALAASLRASPSSTFSVHIQLTGTLLSELSAGRLDFALTSLQDDLPPELSHTVLGSQHVHVVARREHPLHKRSCASSELMAYPWILPSSDIASHSWVRMVFAGLGLEIPEAFVRTDSSTLALASLVADSDALTVMAAGSVAIKGGALKPLPLPAEYCTLDIVLCWRRKAYMSASMRQFRQHITQAFARRNRAVPFA